MQPQRPQPLNKRTHSYITHLQRGRERQLSAPFIAPTVYSLAKIIPADHVYGVLTRVCNLRSERIEMLLLWIEATFSR